MLVVTGIRSTQQTVPFVKICLQTSIQKSKTSHLWSIAKVLRLFTSKIRLKHLKLSTGNRQQQISVLKTRIEVSNSVSRGLDLMKTPQIQLVAQDSQN